MKYLGAAGVLILVLLAASHAGKPAYDIIVVRADIPIDYLISQSFSHKEGIPILISDPNALTEDARKSLQGLIRAGGRKVLIIGGKPQAITVEVEKEIFDMGFEVYRIGDWDRIGTAARVASDLWGTSEYGVLMNGNSYDSGLVASRLSLEFECPILLTDGKTISDATHDAIIKLGMKYMYVVPADISEEVLSQLAEMNITTILVRENLGSFVRGTSLEEKFLNPYSIFMGIIVGCAAAYLYVKIARRERHEVPFFVLTEDERKVVEAIGETGIKQEDIPHLTNFSRPKVTKIVADLESKKIIEREKEGKTYNLRMAKTIVEE